MAAPEAVALSTVKALGKTPDFLKSIYTIQKHQLYIGFSKTIPDTLVEQFQNELDEMKKSGSYNIIVNSYYNKIY